MTPEEISNEVLTEIEKDKIIAFCADTVAFEAVKKYVLAYLYDHGVIGKGKPHRSTKNFALKMAFGALGLLQNPMENMPRSDEELGQNIRALAQAVSIVESGFKEMADIKIPDKLEEEETNPAE